MRLRTLERRSFFGDERGQAIVLAGLLMLFVFVAVMLTFAIGHRTREKIKMQALADSGAYSLAVAEARTFNFWAFTNRARVAHDVAILSVQSHISYITYLEGIMDATGRALNQTAWEMGLECLALCWNSGICCQCPMDIKAVRKTAKYFRGSDWPAAKWMHEQWHQSDTWDKVIGGAAVSHYLAIGALRAEQYWMGAQLLEEIARGPQRLAQTVDPKINAPALSGDAVTLGYLIGNPVTGEGGAVYFPPPGQKGEAGDDWLEIAAATRHNNWVTNRSFVWASLNWDGALAIGLSKMVSNCIYEVWPTANGNAKITQTANSASGLAGRIHSDQSDTMRGWGGEPEGYGAEDHGSVNVFVECYDGCVGYGRGSTQVGVFAEAQDHNKHFYSDSPVNKSENDIPAHKLPSTGGEDRIYMTHPRYKWGKQDTNVDSVWNYPKTVTLLTKEMPPKTPSGDKQIYDFNFDMTLPLPAHFTTTQSKGDTQANGKMAAIAGGMAYYHKPKKGNSDAWKEPPSFWNPFWRAKLHPLKRSDYAKAVAIGHTSSATGTPYLEGAQGAH